MDKANIPSHLDTAPAGNDSHAASPFDAHQLLASPDRTMKAAALTGGSDGKYLPSLSLTDFDHSAENFLARYAPDGGNNVTRADLARLMSDPDIKGADATTLATLYGLSQDSSLYTQAGSLPAWGIHSISDIAAAPTSAAGLTKDKGQIAQLSKAIDYANFSKADSNHDGVLSLAELQHDPLYANLLKAVPDLAPQQGATDYSLTLDMVNHDLEKILARDAIQSMAVKADNILQQRLQTTTTTALFSDSANPLNSIKVADVHQGETGDCYFEATLAEVAQQDPAIIRDAIKTNPNGTYTVTFKGDAQHPITIDPPTQAELALYNGGSNDGLWPAVMEKAYAAYGTLVLKRPGNDLTNEDAVAGGNSDGVMQLLTGRTPMTLTNFPYIVPGTLGSKDGPTYSVDPQTGLDAGLFSSGALDHKGLAVLETTDFPTTDKLGLVTHHDYSVVAYQPGADGGLVTLHNPWGTEDLSGSATIQITMKKLFSIPMSVTIDMGGGWSPEPRD